MLTETITTAEAARLLGLSQPSVTRLIREGKLSAVKPGGHWRVSRDDVGRHAFARPGDPAEPPPEVTIRMVPGTIVRLVCEPAP